MTTASRSKTKNRKFRAQAFFIFIAAALALLAQIFFGMSGERSQKSLAKATKLYETGKLNEALAVVEGEPNQYIAVDGGCELLISVFAETGRNDLLENAAIRCIDAGKGTGIAHEGFGKALQSQGRALEAIMALEKEAKRLGHPRIHWAIANLYLYQGDYEGVAKNLSAAMKVADSWSPWLDRALGIQELATDPTFIESAIETVLAKKTKDPSVERKLLQAATSLNLSDSVAKLSARL